jgi:hypothetical protein
VIARPLFALALLAVAGASALVLAGARAPGGYVPALLGALAVLLALGRLLRELRPRDRRAIAGGAAALGFLCASVAAVGPHPAALSFAAAFLPALVLILLGFGRERLAFELSRLEEAIDDPAARPAARARARAIRDEARSAARALDPEATGGPAHPGDPRAVFAYAAEVLADACFQDGSAEEAALALGDVPSAWMPAAMRPLMLGNLAFFRLAAGAPEAALAGLDAEPAAGPAVRAARALALVHLDRAAEALALVGRSDDDSLPPERLRARYAIVRALSLAALGEAAAARAALTAARALPEGDAELARLRPAVPAQLASLLG